MGITYNGDGKLLARAEADDSGSIRHVATYFSAEYGGSPNTLVIQSEAEIPDYVTIYIHATEGESYAAKTISFELERND